MSKLFFNVTICLGVVLFFYEFSFAQQFADVSDELYIELSLDLIRKGVQQEDTVKVTSVFANQVAAKSAIIDSKNNLTKKFQSIFDKSSQRKFLLTKSSVSKTAQSNKSSNMWDFDILSPKIEIRGDSAFVECELVLWGASSIDGKDNGAKIKEQFVFFAPPKIQPSVVDEGYHEWGSIEPRQRKRPKTSGWVLVRCDNFFEFLENYGAVNVQLEKSNGRQK